MRTGTPQIDRVTVWAVDLPMRRLFTSAAAGIQLRRLAIIKIDAAGVVGWGEAAPVAGHTEDFRTTWSQLTTALSGRAGNALSILPGLARAAYEQALTDVAAKLDGLPLWEYLGATEPVVASAAIGLDENHRPDGTAIAAAAAAGYRHMKVKVDARSDPALLRRTLAAHPGVAFGADANESLAVCGKPHLMAMDELGLTYLEQPGKAADLDWHRQLRTEIGTPIALDESASSRENVAAIAAVGAADIVTLKAGRFGTTTTLEIAQEVARSGLRVRLGGLLESGIGRAHSVALAGRREFSAVGDIAASDLYFTTDLVNPPWRLQDGIIERSPAPGIGVDVDEQYLARHGFDSLLAE